jgi:hypothetical protein
MPIHLVYPWPERVALCFRLMELTWVESVRVGPFGDVRQDGDCLVCDLALLTVFPRS